MTGEYTVSIDEFKGSIRFPDIPPGETLRVVYTMHAFGSNGLIEFGYSAFLGDPADLSVGGGGEVIVNPAGDAVPEPASLLLSGLGLVALAAIRRRK